MIRVSRTLLLLLITFFVLLGAYAAAGFLGVPRLVRSTLQEFVTEKYGRQVSIGEIRCNPFLLTLEIRDAVLPDDDGERLLAFARLLVNLDISSVWRRGASFSEIALEQPFARTLVRSDGTLNLADLTKPFEAQSDAAEDAKPTRLFIDRLRVERGEVAFEDRKRATPFGIRLQPITFELRDFSTTGGTGNAYTLTGSSAAGERFEWNGTFSLNPLFSRGQFALTNVQARTPWSYARDAVAFEVSSGVIDLNGDYEFSSTPALQLTSRLSRTRVTNLGIRPQGAHDDYVQVDQLQIDDTLFDLANRQVTVGKVRMTGGTLQVWLDDAGHINLSKLLALPTNEAAEPSNASKEPESPWKVAVPDVGVEALKVAFEDRHFQPAAAFTLAPITLNVMGFSNEPEASVDVTLDAGINGDGKLRAEGKAVPGSGAFTAHVDLSDIDLTAAQPYIAEATQMTLLNGSLGTQLDVERTADGIFSITGTAEVRKLHTIDNALREDFIKWERLKLANIEYRSEPARLRIGTIDALAPYARVVIAPDRTFNVAHVLSRSPTAPPARQLQQTRPAAKKTEAMSVSIGAVRIANGSMNFADFWIQPNYAVSIEQLHGTVAGLSSKESSRAKVELNGKVDRYAPAHIAGEVNLLSASLFSDIKMSFKGVDMTSVTPYSGRFAGYRIEKGKLSVDLEYHVENRKLNADHRFVIDQLQLGEKVESPDAVKLPLKLAVAVLKDRNGVIDVGLPVTGSLDDPEFRLGPIIWKAVVNLLTKIATAPFAMLGQLFGGGEDLNLIDFTPGESTLDAAEQEKLATLLKALRERPQLRLDVPMAYSVELDGPALAKQRLDAKLLALAQQRRKRDETTPADVLITDPERRFELLVELHRLELGRRTPLPPTAIAAEAARDKKDEPPDYSQAIADLESAIGAQQPITPAEIEALGKQRAQAIQEALLGSGEIDPSRVFVIAAREQPREADGKVRVEMSLQ